MSVDVLPGGPADPLSPASCAPLRKYFEDPAKELIMHMQVGTYQLMDWVCVPALCTIDLVRVTEDSVGSTAEY